MQICYLSACNNAVSFRHTKADFSVIWWEQQSGSVGHGGHYCPDCLLGLICLVVCYDAQEDSSIQLQSSTGTHLHIHWLMSTLYLCFLLSTVV